MEIESFGAKDFMWIR